MENYFNYDEMYSFLTNHGIEHRLSSPQNSAINLLGRTQETSYCKNRVSLISSTSVYSKYTLDAFCANVFLFGSIYNYSLT